MNSRNYHGYIEVGKDKYGGIEESCIDLYVDRYVNIGTAHMIITHKGRYYDLKHKFSLDYSDKEMAIRLAGCIIEDNNITDLKAEQVAKAVNKRWKIEVA